MSTQAKADSGWGFVVAGLVAAVLFSLSEPWWVEAIPDRLLGWLP